MAMGFDLVAAAMLGEVSKSQMETDSVIAAGYQMNSDQKRVAGPVDQMVQT